MKTHSLRLNKTKTQRILSFSRPFEDMLRSAHPWASRAFIGAMLKETGASLDSEQTQRLEQALYGVPETTLLAHRALQWISACFRLMDTGVEEGLDALNAAVKGIFGGPSLESWGLATLPGPTWFTALGARRALSDDARDAVRFASEEAATRTLSLMLDTGHFRLQRAAYAVQRLPTS